MHAARFFGFCIWPKLTCLLLELQEEFLVENKSHAADLFHLGLSCCVPVDEIGSDGDG